MRQKFGKAMKLHEIYEGYVRFRSVREIASRILSIEMSIKYDGKCKQQDLDWLVLKCEDENLLNSLRREAKRYTNFNKLGFGDGNYLTTASDLAKALDVLVQEKRTLDDKARTKINQATDEAIHSDEMAEIVKQQAYIDLQNSYAQAESDSAKRVGALAKSATDS